MIQYEYYPVNVPGEKLYPEGVKIEVRKITPFEQKRLFSSMNQITELEEINANLINFVKGLVKIEGMEFEDLYYPDFQYLLYQIRHVTYQLFPLEFYYTCEDCGEKQVVKVNLAQLDIEDKTEIQKTIHLDNHGEVPIRFKRIKDDLIIDKFMRSKGIDNNDLIMRILVLDMLLLDQWQPLEETWNMAEMGDITLQDTTRIEEFAASNLWGVKEEVNIVCRKCNKEVAVPYSVEPANFFSAYNN